MFNREPKEEISGERYPSDELEFDTLQSLDSSPTDPRNMDLNRLYFFHRMHSRHKIHGPMTIWAEEQATIQRKTEKQRRRMHPINPAIRRRQIDKAQKKRLKRIFQRFASEEHFMTGEPLMTPEDLIRSLSRPALIGQDDGSLSSVSQRESKTLRMLFNMADTNETGKINFSEFVLLFKLLTTPESEFELAFRAFDVNNDGTISREEFQQVMLQNKDSIKVDFDFDCDLMTRFFGRDGRSELSYIQFSHFMRLLQEEIRRQEFHHLDKDMNGWITAQQFAEWLTAYMQKGTVPAKLQSNIEHLKDSFQDKNVSYAEFDAFNRIMGNIGAIANSLRNAATQTPDGTVTKESFSRTAKQITGITISPLEISILFKMFQSKHSENPDEVEQLYPEDFEEFLDVITNDQRRRQAALDLWAKDRLEHSDGALEEVSKMRAVGRAIANFALTTLYGGVAGAIGATTVYPIDLVKTRMQNQRTTRDGGVRLYANSLDCFKKIIRNEGAIGLYRGLMPQLVGVAPEKAIKLVTNEYLRNLFEDPTTKEMYFPLEILAGGCAGASQVIATNPLEIVKIRLQIQGEIARETGAAPKKATAIIRELGFSGLYKGSSACFLRDIPFSAIYFPLYATLKERFRHPEEAETRPAYLLLAGTAAGVVAAGIVTPFDVIKTRLQVETRKGQDTYSGIADCFRKVYAKEGPSAFFKGCAMRMCRSGPQFGVTLLSFELLERVWKKPAPEPTKTTLAANVPVEQQDLEALRAMYQTKFHQLGNLFGYRSSLR